MRVISAILTWLLFAPLPTRAANSNWETCIDLGDFNFSYLQPFDVGGTIMASKTACRFTFADTGGKGEKLELDVCDPLIHIDYYPSLDGATSRRILAGAAGCPAPQFGADFDEKAKEYNEYRDMRAKVFDFWSKIKNDFGKDWETVKLEKIRKIETNDTKERIACGQFLLREYLEKCMSFEAKKPEPASGPSLPPPPGVHPQTILVPKK